MRAALQSVAISTLLQIGAGAAAAQDPVPAPPTPDSITVEGNTRVTADVIIGLSGIRRGEPVAYRAVQRAVQALFGSAQFDDVRIELRELGERTVIAIVVQERPVLSRWSVRGTEQIEEGTIRRRITVPEGRPLDRAALERSRAAVDSLYRRRGYYAVEVKVTEIPEAGNRVRLLFDIAEGHRVAVSQVLIEGNERFPDREVVKGLATRPEGFWWFRKGEYSDERVEEDLRSNLPTWYADRGHVDLRVLGDSLIADSVPGKAILRIRVHEGPAYRVGRFDIGGNRRFSTEDLSLYFPFGRGTVAGNGREVNVAFSRSEWDAATERVKNLYANSGYIYSQVEPEEIRRIGPDSQPVLDLRWRIVEGQPATINKVLIVGNDITHERVIREAIVLLPGQIFNRDLLIRSYQNVSNLNFFQQPLASPDVQPAENGVDVNIVFRVEERRTGNINFGASVGQGVGLGGFLGLEEPNLFGKAKRGKLQWQFGRNINDFNLSYTDPAIRESRISGTLSLFDSRRRFTVGDLGRERRQGTALQLGFPFLGSRYTRVFASYGFQRIRYTEGSADLRQFFNCENCSRSSVGLSLARDTRIGLPFAIAGTSVTASSELNGGPLGGTGDYQKLDFEGRWYTPLGRVGGEDAFGGGVQFTLGLTAKSGFVFGDAGPFFTELYSMGGVQFGIPLRGYQEFAITPSGFDPNAGGTSARPDAFGKAYAAFTIEGGARLSQALYANVFLDAGNVYRRAREYNPTRMFRSVGAGVALISPLGPIGLDLGYGLDKVDEIGRPKPGWQMHFRLGNFF